MKKIYLVRHGETEGNKNKFFQFPDTVLTKAGHEGASSVASRFKNIPVDIILASPYVRAQQTAEYISKVVNKPIVTHDSLHEIKQAESVIGKRWDSPEGVAYIEAQKKYFFDPSWENDGAETHTLILERIKKVVDDIENLDSENIVVVSHGQFLGLLSIFLMLDKDTESSSHKVLYNTLHLLSNVAITEFIFSDNQWKLFTYNDHAHFAE